VEQTVRVLVNEFVRRVRVALADPVQTRELWQARLVHRPGEVMRVRVEGAVIEGRFVGFTPEGYLEVEVDGCVKRIASGEVVPRPDDEGGEHAPGA
jgi:biotin-(acetyl-CoA carboxylase) ligase